MNEEVRRDRSGEPDHRPSPDRGYDEEQDELALRRREHGGDRPALTRREREERWPIG
ncbi:MAG TPA: hypothetical protein VL383_08780 [Gemmatimonadaceae bacterium]|jgi:hypothetical protein|nr:hypothetical protein [Gemmatimonadaceae bacterium]